MKKAGPEIASPLFKQNKQYSSKNTAFARFWKPHARMNLLNLLLKILAGPNGAGPGGGQGGSQNSVASYNRVEHQRGREVDKGGWQNSVACHATEFVLVQLSGNHATELRPVDSVDSVDRSSLAD